MVGVYKESPLENRSPLIYWVTCPSKAHLLREYRIWRFYDFFSFAGLRRISPGTCRDQSQLRVHHSKLSIDFPEWKWSNAAAHWLLKPVVSLAWASVSQKDGVSITWGFPFLSCSDCPPPSFFLFSISAGLWRGWFPSKTSWLIQGAPRPLSQGPLLLVWPGPRKSLRWTYTGQPSRWRTHPTSPTHWPRQHWWSWHPRQRPAAMRPSRASSPAPLAYLSQ